MAALALFAIASPHHRADIRFLTHDQGDHNPRRLQAAVDIGIVAVSVVITWTQKLTR